MPDSTPIYSDQFGPRKFKPHGRVTYEYSGKMLWANAIGPFNQELMAAVLEMARIAFPVMTAQGPWVHICTFHESALCSPEVLTDLGSALSEMARGGVAPQAMAFVLPAAVEGSALMGPLYAKVFQGTGVPFAHFADRDAACAWVESVFGAWQSPTDTRP
ncbi:hypothetical protein AEP_03792 [Curvibacter sp. AEP1-3]|uniref:hypothetical protein n=1 Tax=Curvibacter sp. AEP1-3 TaxID=1844971 RepID=UPI000B3D363D|nr:hypothetical protein [Curvibacter sp. AEP1-3]ARV20709.1 hypothetical protein AEP_03792 [Curvibacter sp. AEP1-3]